MRNVLLNQMSQIKEWEVYHLTKCHKLRYYYWSFMKIKLSSRYFFCVNKIFSGSSHLNSSTTWWLKETDSERRDLMIH